MGQDKVRIELYCPIKQLSLPFKGLVYQSQSGSASRLTP